MYLYVISFPRALTGHRIVLLDATFCAVNDVYDPHSIEYAIVTLHDAQGVENDARDTPYILYASLSPCARLFERTSTSMVVPLSVFPSSV